MPAGSNQAELAAAVAAALVAAGYRPVGPAAAVRTPRTAPIGTAWAAAGRRIAHRGFQLANERRRGRLKWLK